MKHRLNTHCHFCKNIVNRSSKSRTTKKDLKGHPIQICVSCQSSPPNGYRCKGRVGKGTSTNPERRCKKWATWGKKVCRMHKNQ